MFRLDRVLRWKERLEKEALVRRAKAEAAMYELEAAVARLRAERAGLPDVDGAAFDTLVTWANYAEALRRREERVRQRLIECRPLVEEAALLHLKARREVEGLRKLKERTRLRQRKRAERQQQEVLDDAASRTFLPGGGSEFPLPDEPDEAGPTGEDAEMALEAEISPKREKEA